MEQEALTCCGKTFSYKIVMEMHKDAMHKKDKVKEAVQILQKTILLKNEKVLKKVACHFPNCATLSAKRGLLKKHIRDIHESIDIYEESICVQCGKVYKNEKSMSAHVRNAHSDEIQKCLKCPYETKSYQQLYDHTYREHSNRMIKQQSCEFCGKVLKKLAAHLKSTMCGKNIDDRKLLQCPQCKRRFIDKSSLTKHIQYIHNNVKDKDCPHCSYQTYSSFNLRLHVSKVHEKTSMFQNCPHCGKTTGNLDLHGTTYHREQMSI